MRKRIGGSVLCHTERRNASRKTDGKTEKQLWHEMNRKIGCKDQSEGGSQWQEDYGVQERLTACRIGELTGRIATKDLSNRGCCIPEKLPECWDDPLFAVCEIVSIVLSEFGESDCNTRKTGIIVTAKD
jgi:hypothetical protein